MLKAVRKVPDFGICSAKPLYLFPETDTDVPVVVHIFMQQGRLDLAQGVRIKFVDIHSSVAKGPMSDAFYREKTSESLNQSAIIDNNAKLVAAWHARDPAALTAYFQTQLTEHVVQQFERTTSTVAGIATKITAMFQKETDRRHETHKAHTDEQVLQVYKT